MKEKSKVARRFISDIADIMWSLGIPVVVVVVAEVVAALAEVAAEVVDRSRFVPISSI